EQVFNCRGCGVGGDVITLVQHLDGLDFTSAIRLLTGEPSPKTNGKDRTEFLYTDESGTTLFAVERTEDGKRGKTFKQKRPDPDNPRRWLWNVDGVPVVPYRLPEMIEAIAAERPVLVVEGERKVDLLWSWNMAATCNAGGAKKWRPAHSEYLRNADVIVMPDNDDAGWAHVNLIGASLAGIAKRIRVLVLPGLPPKGDIIDWAAAGGTREQLHLLIAEAPDWKADFDGIKQADIDAKRKTDAEKSEDELLDALAQMSPGVRRGRERKRLAKEWGINARGRDRSAWSRVRDKGIASRLVVCRTVTRTCRWRLADPRHHEEDQEAHRHR